MKTILLVEDDPGDVMMTREAFEEHKLRNRLTVVSDGAEALSYLRREGEYADAVPPDLILLDANPLQDIGNLWEQAGIMVRGRWLPGEEIERRLNEIATQLGN